jgi:SAM-dependent methyltransferase
MDVIERLPLEAASAYTLLVCEHRHRYEFARELCRGLRVLDLCCGSGYGSEIMAEKAATVVGVDYDTATVDAARAAIKNEKVSFETADAVSYLELPLAERFDAVVCFEGLEHLPELEGVLRGLRRQVDAGTKLVISVPNSKLFNEQNPHHLTDFSYDTAIAAFADFPERIVVPQYLAEGSVICPTNADSVDLIFVPEDRLEIEYANHFIFCLGFDRDAVESTHRGRIQVEAAPVHNRYLRDLEAANSELRKANARLARTHLAIAGSAAATQLLKLEEVRAARDEAIRAANARADQAEHDRDAWKARCWAAEARQVPREWALDRDTAARMEASCTPPGQGDSVRGAGPPLRHDLPERPVRADELEVYEVADGLVVYQAKPERVHYLNNTAAIVFELCNGEKTIPEIRRELAAVFGLSEPSPGLVETCMEDLRSKGVVL